MITRIFKVTIDPAKRADFERGFFSISVAALTDKDGFISCEIGKPTRWSPDTYVMISKWRDEAALVRFAGENWNRPVIPKGMEGFAVSCSVEHYRSE